MAKNNKAPIRLISAGTGKAATAMAPYIEMYNRESDRYEIRPHYVGPDPGQLAQLERATRALQLPATFEEGTIEEFVEADNTSDPVVLHLDQAATIRDVLRHPKVDSRPLLGYFIVGRPDGFFAGVSMALSPARASARDKLADAADALAGATSHDGSEALIGRDAPMRNQLVEPALRRAFAAHLFAALPKLAFGLEPTTPPAQVTRDGRRQAQLVVLDSRSGWRGIPDLGTAVLEERLAPLRPSSRLSVLEIGPTDERGVRIYDARYLRSGALKFGDALAIDPATIESIYEQERQRRLQAEQEARLRAATSSPSWAASMSD